jgi:hypothetical protein
MVSCVVVRSVFGPLGALFQEEVVPFRERAVSARTQITYRFVLLKKVKK